MARAMLHRVSRRCLNETLAFVHPKCAAVFAAAALILASLCNAGHFDPPDHSPPFLLKEARVVDQIHHHSRRQDSVAIRGPARRHVASDHCRGFAQHLRKVHLRDAGQLSRLGVNHKGSLPFDGDLASLRRPLDEIQPCAIHTQDNGAYSNGHTLPFFAPPPILKACFFIQFPGVFCRGFLDELHKSDGTVSPSLHSFAVVPHLWPQVCFQHDERCAHQVAQQDPAGGRKRALAAIQAREISSQTSAMSLPCISIELEGTSVPVHRDPRHVWDTGHSEV
mmetsp:Transcript_92874/g.184365  ORF Transcript_92874/g.184365 Transcript_92874/m.184365 type:complete len:279 (+) Transcript_92874:2027-2863(+)